MEYITVYRCNMHTSNNHYLCMLSKLINVKANVEILQTVKYSSIHTGIMTEWYDIFSLHGINTFAYGKKVLEYRSIT